MIWKAIVKPLAGLVAVLLLIVIIRGILNGTDKVDAARPRQAATAPATNKTPTPAAPPTDLVTLPEGNQAYVIDVPHNPSRVPLWTVEARLLEKTNAARARYGRPPLTLDPAIQKTCRQHCTWMATAHSMTHGNYPVAENIAMGQRDSSEAINTWLTSRKGHRENMLNANHTKVGVASYVASNGTKYWCQQFSR